ncbi:polysaccharide deacetylase family protein [bacterium]|nr:polysaccharide deacetylase family protein [bacterium]
MSAPDLELPDGVWILLYHHVGEESDWVKGQGVTTPFDRFVSHLDFLSERFPMVSLDQAVNILQQQPVRGVHVALTFDDAFRSFGRTAYPELRRRRIPAALFVCTDFAATGEPGWRNRLAYLCNTGRGADVCESLRAAFSPDFPGLTDLRPETVLKWTKNHFRKTEIESAVGNVFERVYGNLTVPLYMSWSDLDEIRQDSLIEIGNHTQSHLMLVSADPEDEQAEIHGAQRKLEQKTGRTIRYFAYPYGGPNHYSDRTRQTIRDMNLIGLSAHGGFNRALDPSDLKRVTITQQDIPELIQKLRT